MNTRFFLPLALGGYIVGAAVASADPIEELLVTGSRDKRVVEVNEALVAAPDPAHLLLKAPGANVNNNGPITGILQYRGMYGSRVAVTINGNQIASAGPNAMDAPISYAAGQLESLQIYRGIAPVSVAQESIGGAVEATLARAEYGQGDDFEISGRVRANAQSTNSGYHLGGVLYGSNNQHRFKLGAMTEAGNDASSPDSDIVPTEYDRSRVDLGYGFNLGPHDLQVDYVRNDTGDAGTPALPMDIRWIESDLLSLQYQYELDHDTRMEVRVYGSDLDHGMTNYHLRPEPMKPDMFRRNQARSRNYGFKLTGVLLDDQGQWLVGADGFSEEHDSDIDNPNNPMFFVVNFNRAQRRILGLFAERQQELGNDLSAEFGLRLTRVDMDAGEVNATPAMMMPPAMMLRESFNNADRKKTDNNVDAVVKLRYKGSDSLSYTLALGRKNRAASYQERYLWLPMQSTGGLADGFTYTGNIGLDSEVAHEIELGLDFNGSNFTLSPRLFYRDVKDYIQGTPSSNTSAVMLVRMMNMMNDTNNPDPLEFNNVDASLWGFDMDWAWRLDSNWSFSGLVNYVRGKREDIGDDLYRIAPPNATVGLNYDQSTWSARIESVLYSKQDHVSQTNAERQTAGYGIVNLSASWQATSALQLAAGVENLLDKEYDNHIGGYNRVRNSDIAVGQRLPGYGINGFLRMTYEF